MSLGSNGVDRERSFQKIPMRLRGTKFSLIAPVQPILYRASCSNEIIQNAPKHYETHLYMSLGFNRVDRVRSLQKFWCDFMARTCALIAPVQPVLYWGSCSNKTIQNTSKHYETHQNMSFGRNGVDREPSLQKNLMQLCGTNFCTNCTSSTRFATSFV